VKLMATIAERSGFLKSAATGHGGAARYGDAGAIPGCGHDFGCGSRVKRRSLRCFFNDGTTSALPLNFGADLSSHHRPETSSTLRRRLQRRKEMKNEEEKEGHICDGS
jgi:hypothetical protein